MMNKRIVSVIIIVLVMPIMLSTTCSKEDRFWEIDNVRVEFTGSDNNFNGFVGDTIINTDTLLMKLNIIPKNIYSMRRQTPFIKEAYALTRLSPDLKHTISSLKISSNVDFNSIEAGESLNDLIIVYQNFGFHTVSQTWMLSDSISIQEYINTYYRQGAWHEDIPPVVLLFNEIPMEAKHVFNFDFTDSQGTHFISATDTLVWN